MQSDSLSTNKVTKIEELCAYSNKHNESPNLKVTLSEGKKTLDIKSRIKQKKKLKENEEGSLQDKNEQNVHPLHTQWKFTKTELDSLRKNGKVDINSLIKMPCVFMCHEILHCSVL